MLKERLDFSDSAKQNFPLKKKKNLLPERAFITPVTYIYIALTDLEYIYIFNK